MRMASKVRMSAGAAAVVAAGLLGACSAHVEVGKSSGVDKGQAGRGGEAEA